MNRRRLDQEGGGEEQRHAEGLRLQPRGEGADGVARVLQENVVVVDLGEAPQVPRRDRGGRRFRPVVVLLHPQEDGRIAVAGGKVAAVELVPEMEVERVLQPPRPAEPAEIEIGRVELQQAVDEKRVVGGEAGNGGGALPVAPPQLAALGVVKMIAQEHGRALGRAEGGGVAEDLRRPRQGADHQAVPGRENLVVEMRAGRSPRFARSMARSSRRPAGHVVRGPLETLRRRGRIEALDEHVHPVELAVGIGGDRHVSVRLEAVDRAELPLALLAQDFPHLAWVQT